MRKCKSSTRLSFLTPLCIRLVIYLYYSDCIARDLTGLFGKEFGSGQQHFGGRNIENDREKRASSKYDKVSVLTVGFY